MQTLPSGVMFPPVKMVTAQGYDLQFGTNVLGSVPMSFRMVDYPIPSRRPFLFYPAPYATLTFGGQIQFRW
jgi:hypothetical protein